MLADCAKHVAAPTLSLERGKPPNGLVDHFRGEIGTLARDGVAPGLTLRPVDYDQSVSVKTPVSSRTECARPDSFFDTQGSPIT